MSEHTVYWGWGSATCWWGEDEYCTLKWPEGKGKSKTFTGSLPYSDAKSSASDARDAIWSRIEGNAIDDDACWNVPENNVHYELEEKTIED